MEDCRVKLQSICTNRTNISFVFGDNVNSSFYLEVVSSLLASSTSFLFNKANDDKLTRGVVSIAPALKTITDLIVKEEATLCTASLSNDWKEMPKWLDGVSDSRSDGVNVFLLPGLYGSICRLLSRFMSRAFLHPDSETQLTMASTISRVYGCRRMIESLNRDVPDHVPSFIQYVSPETLSLLSHAMEKLLNDENTKVEDFRLIMTGIEGVCDDVSSLAQGVLGDCASGRGVKAFRCDILALSGSCQESPISQLLSFLEKTAIEVKHPDQMMMVCSYFLVLERLTGWCMNFEPKC
ncbi:hypothetical protein MHU86_15603 [Fragilaria crotonensis]|nr:hypothetical protein MHU86_15603 [Fragilaria crotonensis]